MVPLLEFPLGYTEVNSPYGMESFEVQNLCFRIYAFSDFPITLTQLPHRIQSSGCIIDSKAKNVNDNVANFAELTIMS